MLNPHVEGDRALCGATCGVAQALSTGQVGVHKAQCVIHEAQVEVQKGLVEVQKAQAEVHKAVLYTPKVEV